MIGTTIEGSRDRRVPWQLGRIYSDEVDVVVWAETEPVGRQRASDWAGDASYLDSGSTTCKPLQGGLPRGTTPVVGDES